MLAAVGHIVSSLSLISSVDVINYLAPTYILTDLGAEPGWSRQAAGCGDQCQNKVAGGEEVV